LSRIDEIWQQEQWGVDEEAAEVAARKESEFRHAAAFLERCETPSSD
jgi:chaperone required for assembly of F1-ATPase